jgi:hypothetical protein
MNAKKWTTVGTVAGTILGVLLSLAADKWAPGLDDGVKQGLCPETQEAASK